MCETTVRCEHALLHSCGDMVAAAGSVFGDCHSEGEDETSNTEALLQVRMRCRHTGSPEWQLS